jgi:hypothetical protein
MKLTRERKIYGVILVLAVAALGFDQFTGSSSSDSSGAPPVAQEDPGSLLLASAPASRGNASGVSASKDDQPTLAQRLAAAAPAGAALAPEHIRDVFRIPRAWTGSGPAPVADNTAALAAERFVQTHKLTAVSKSGADAGGGVAAVDGKLLHPGAVLDGFKLVAVTRTSAIFDCGGAQVVLQLKTDAAAASISTDAPAGR